MGGFSYYDENQELQVLHAREMERLYNEDIIEWPRVTTKQIKDHSKNDYIVKTIALVQTTWFCVQVIVRLATNLVVTELEISTMAFAVLNLFVYILWWNKPFDVRTPIVVPGKYSPSVRYKSASPLEWRELRPEEDIDALPLNLYLQQIRTSIKQTLGICCSKPESENPENVVRKKVLAMPYLKRKLGEVVQAIRHPFKGDNVLVNGLLGSPFVTYHVEKGYTHHWSEPDCYDTPAARARHPLCGRLFAFLNQFRVLCLISGTFGAIHFVAWSFTFLTVAEMWLWRACSIALTVSSIFFLVNNQYCRRRTVAIESGDSYGFSKRILRFFGFLTLLSYGLLYATARIIIAILPLIALRRLPPGAYVDIQWTSLIPHL
ncbi:hypothetical protein CVT24_006237 [Panaeolus cyanescens]|uniref:Uncharacterized protein n=1 Tax=Panaeolus cyanescens TaxID=181874 RepID=A0A409YEH3_9AGAR|nr:hypothetical protein CVT24_006237 [Panaeolus cyanescens]